MERFVESPEGQEIAALCIDYGYKLANTPADLTRPQINFLMASLANRMEKMVESRTRDSGITRFVFVEDEELTEA